MNKEEIEKLKYERYEELSKEELKKFEHLINKYSKSLLAYNLIMEQQENQQLKENNMSMQEEMVRTWKKTDLYKEVIKEVREYITSYNSIHTIQFGTEEDSLNDIELNKTLDNKTITEMTHRYLKVHDKLLQILDKGDKE